MATAMRALSIVTTLTLVRFSFQQENLQWFWDRNHYVPEYGFDPQRSEQRTLLVVQDAAYGAEQEVIEVTQRVNRAYAKRWGYDYAKLVGIAIGNQPWQRSFNKAYILDQLVKARTTDNGFRVYDTVLMLDSNAVIVDLDFDILSLIPTNKLLANGIRNERDIKDMYSDVMMWNLYKPEIQDVATKWIDATKNSVDNSSVNSSVLLLEVIKNEFSIHDQLELLEPIPQRFVNGLDGTVIKQDGKSIKDVIEISDLPIIIPTLQGLADSACYRFYPQCEVIGNI